MSRHLALLAAGVLTATAAPSPGWAQKQMFVDGVARLATASLGTFGDEGPEVLAAIDQMARGLEAWDRAIAAAETGAAAASNAPPDAVFQKRLALAGLYIDRGRLPDALREIDATLHLDDRRPELHLLRGAVLEAAHRDGEAAVAFQAAWRLAPSDPAHAYRVHQWSVRDPAGAPRADDVLQAAYGQLAAAGTRRGTAAFLRIELLPDAAASAPLLPPALYADGFGAIRRGDYAAAVAAFRHAAAADPLVTGAAASDSMRRGIAALRLGNVGAARPLLLAVPAASSESHRVVGLLEAAAANYDSSLRHLDDALRARPDDERARLTRALVLVRAGRSGDGEQALLATIRDLPQSALARWHLGTLYEGAHRAAEARRQFEATAASAIAGAAPLHDRLGRLARIEGDFAGAIQAFEHSVRVRPNDAATHKQLARAYLEQDRGDEAFAELVAAMLIEPGDGDAHAAVGRIALDAGRDAQAVTALRRALSLQPGLHEARYALATALRRTGQADAAARELAAFERAQQQQTETRRRDIAGDVRDEEAALQRVLVTEVPGR